MSINRREFINESAMLVSGAIASPIAASAAGSARAISVPASGSTPSAGGPADRTARAGRPIVEPFAETRGGRSANPAIETRALAAHCVDVKYSDLDEATLRRAKRRVLDLVGCAIGGVPDPGNSGLIDMLRASGGAPQASVIGYPLKTSAAHAALANAVIARSYDFEVMTVVVAGRAIGSHNSPTTCMTALALCEKRALSGKDFLAALVVGDDLAARLLAASGLDLGLGWDGAAIYTAIPATAIASRLLGLTAGQTQDAFGLALDTIAGTNQNTWDSATDWKLPQGYSARNAIHAAELGRRGWVGIGDALRAPYGFFAQYTAGCEHPEVLTAGLGKVFYSEEYFKPYPACAASHTSIECALAVRASHGLSPSQIERVTVRIPPATFASPLALRFEPSRYSHSGANFSIHFQVTNALLNGSVRQEHYDERRIRRSDFAALSSRVRLAPLPEPRTGVEIEVVTVDGRTLTQRNSGTPSRYPGVNPLGYDEIVAKFRQQVAFSGFVPNATADEIIERVDTLERETSIRDFVELLTRSHFAGRSA